MLVLPPYLATPPAPLGVEDYHQLQQQYPFTVFPPPMGFNQCLAVLDYAVTGAPAPEISLRLTCSAGSNCKLVGGGGSPGRRRRTHW